MTDEDRVVGTSLNEKRLEGALTTCSQGDDKFHVQFELTGLAVTGSFVERDSVFSTSAVVTASATESCPSQLRRD